MYELKNKIGKVFTSKFVGTGPSSYKKRIYRAVVPQRLRNTALGDDSAAKYTDNMRKIRRVRERKYRILQFFHTHVKVGK